MKHIIDLIDLFSYIVTSKIEFKGQVSEKG